MHLTWVAETAGILASASLLIALIILLAVYDDKPVFEWKGVTLNAVVSVLSTASKAALLYSTSELISQWKWIVFTATRRPLIDFHIIDAASRGPLGSSEIIWRSREVGWLRLGALVVVLSIAVDPMNQQLIQFKQRVVYSLDPSTTFKRAGRYARGAETFLRSVLTSQGKLQKEFALKRRPLNERMLTHKEPESHDLTTVIADADHSMKSSILYGMDQPMWNIVQRATFNCPTGNCTWPSFESLAVCNRCTDVKERLKRFVPDSGQYLGLGEEYRGTGITWVNDSATAFKLPNGLYLINTNGWRYGSPDTDYGAVMMTSLGTADATDTLSAYDLDTLIWSMSILRGIPYGMTESVAWPDIEFYAMECALFYCVNSYEFKVSNGALTVETEQVMDAKRAKGSWNAGVLNEFLNESALESIAFQKYYSGLGRTDLSLVSPASGRRYNISQAAVDSISSYYQSTFASELLKFNISDSETGRLNGYYIASPHNEYKPSVMQVLFSRYDLNDTFTKLAVSMSNAIRTGSDGSFDWIQNNVYGNKGELKTFYRVVWPWISLHCFIVVAGMLFLLFTVDENMRHGREVPAWKSSSLAVLKHGHGIGGILSGMHTVKNMEAVSKICEVVFFDKAAEVSSLEHLEFDPLEVES